MEYGQHMTTTAATALDMLKRNRLDVEKVSENYEPQRGEMSTRTFWIVYPSYVAGYGRMTDRVAHSICRASTRREAIETALRMCGDFA